MQLTLSQLKQGEIGIIEDVSSNKIPLKLLEMGCLPGNLVSLVQIAPFKDPLYLNINGTYLAIRKEIAKHILIKIESHA